jgi:hypothetical protein
MVQRPKRRININSEPLWKLQISNIHWSRISEQLSTYIWNYLKQFNFLHL